MSDRKWSWPNSVRHLRDSMVGLEDAYKCRHKLNVDNGERSADEYREWLSTGIRISKAQRAVADDWADLGETDALKLLRTINRAIEDETGDLKYPETDDG